jgi:nicotinate-nucleotide adenylyltransferase
MRIGLFGGSFNPPHEGHRLVSQQVLTKLGLDAVWWLVSPGNPLKDNSNLAPLEQRVIAARELIDLPNVHATGFEAAHGFRYTYDTLHYLKNRLKGRHLVWIMGADNLAGFHHWERWRDIANLMPMAVYVRPGTSLKAPTSPAAIALSHRRIDESDARQLPFMQAPAWVYLRGLMSTLSSTQIRQSTGKG